MEYYYVKLCGILLLEKKTENLLWIANCNSKCELHLLPTHTVRRPRSITGSTGNKTLITGFTGNKNGNNKWKIKNTDFSILVKVEYLGTVNRYASQSDWKTNVAFVFGRLRNILKWLFSGKKFRKKPKMCRYIR